MQWHFRDKCNFLAFSLWQIWNLSRLLQRPRLCNKARLQSQKFHRVPHVSECIAPCDQPGIEMQSQEIFLKRVLRTVVIAYDKNWALLPRCVWHMCYLQLIFFHCLNMVKKCIFCFRSYALLNITDYRLETAAATFVEAILGLLKCKSTHINFTACINVDHDIVR